MIHAKLKADGSHAVVEEDFNGKPVMDADGANLIEDDGDTAWFGWEDFELTGPPEKAWADPEVLYHVNDVLNDLASDLGVDMEDESVLPVLDDLSHEFARRFNL